MELCSPPSLYSAQASLFRERSFSSPSPSRLPSTDCSPRWALSSRLLPSSAVAWLAVAPASAVSYDELTLSVPSVQPPTDVDLSSILDSLASFAAENPLAIVAGVTVAALPLLLSSLFSQGKPWSSVSAKEAFQKLGEADAQLLDIRSREVIKEDGTPDLRSVKKRVFQVPYTASDDDAYIKKLLAKFKDPPNTTLYILDQFDGNSLSVAKFATSGGFRAACAVKGGAEGPNGWRNSDLPWVLPRTGFTFDISSLKDVIDSTFSENPNLVPATLGVAAAAGVSLVVFSEAETALQILGSAALIQLFVRKFLFAKDRQKTIQELQTFLDTKIAPKELVDELKGISKVLLPKYSEVPSRGQTNGAATSETSPAVGAQTEEITSPGYVESMKVETKPVEEEIKEVETKPVEELVGTIPDTPKASAVPTDPPRSSTPLSPYTQFPDLRPPSSPTSSV